DGGERIETREGGVGRGSRFRARFPQTGAPDRNRVSAVRFLWAVAGLGFSRGWSSNMNSRRGREEDLDRRASRQAAWASCLDWIWGFLPGGFSRKLVSKPRLILKTIIMHIH